MHAYPPWWNRDAAEPLSLAEGKVLLIGNALLPGCKLPRALFDACEP